MFDEVVNSLAQAKELPAVKKIYQNPFVKSKIYQLEKFLDKVIQRNINKAVTPTKKKLTALNWLLINCIVIAYFVGKADAQSIDHFEYVSMNFTIIGIWSIVANIFGCIFLRIGIVLRNASRLALHVFTVLLAAFFVYWAISKLWEFFTKETVLHNETTVEKKIYR